MSYSFGMYFKQVKNKEEAFNIALKFTEICYKNAEEYIKSQKIYIPSIRFSYKKENIGEDANRFWLYRLFNFRFVFWKEYNLLGLSGYNYPLEAASLFDTHICFQNSTDQDYEFDEWSDKIDIFKSKKSIYKNTSVDSLLKKMNGYSREEVVEHLDYYRKSVLYENIFVSLHLNSWLYDNPDNVFKRFAISAIDSMEKELDLNTILKSVMLKEE